MAPVGSTIRAKSRAGAGEFISTGEHDGQTRRGNKTGRKINFLRPRRKANPVEARLRHGNGCTPVCVKRSRSRRARREKTANPLTIASRLFPAETRFPPFENLDGGDSFASAGLRGPCPLVNCLKQIACRRGGARRRGGRIKRGRAATTASFFRLQCPLL